MLNVCLSPPFLEPFPQDENDEDPIFPVSLYNNSIAEGTPPTTSVARITATDEDSGEFGTVYYSISNVDSAGTNGTFSIDETTGVVRTNGTFDRETFSGPYIITVRSNEPKLTVI